MQRFKDTTSNDTRIQRATTQGGNVQRFNTDLSFGVGDSTNDMTDKAILVARRGVIKGQITRFLKAVQSLSESDDIFQLKIRREKVEEGWQEFQQIQDKLEALSTDNDEEERRIEFENTYFNVVAEYEKLLDARSFVKGITTNNLNKATSENENNNSVSNKSYQSSIVKLSALKVPEFNGEYEKWSSFCDMFVALIHSNEALSDVQKFFYLKSALIGDAKKVIQCYDVNDKNYLIAWKCLNERYNNKRVLVQVRIKSIFDLEPVDNDCSNKLRNFIDSFNSHMQALESMGYEPYQWSPILLHIVTTKMNGETLRAWETIASKTEVPKIEEFIRFLKDRFQILEAVENANNIKTKNSEVKIVKFTDTKTIKNKHFQRRTTVNLAISKLKCYVCEGEHPIYRCKQFLDESVNNRSQLIRNLKICENCLTRHADKRCKFKGCRKCGKLHNTLLHVDEILPLPSNQITAVSAHAAINSHTQVLLATAIINIYDNFNNPIAVRALLDSGSQSNFITERLARQLCKPLKKINCSIHGVDGTTSKATNAITTTIGSLTTSYKNVYEFLTLPKITTNLPAEQFDNSKFELPNHIKLADPSYSVPRKIDVLLGAENFYEILSDGIFKCSAKGPIFKETKLGWVVSGPVYVSAPNQTHTFFIQGQSLIEEQITKFWKIEEYPVGGDFNLEEKKCVQHFDNNVSRGIDGRFIVKLPFINNRRELGDSRKIALRRFLSLEKRLQYDNKIKKGYIDFMQEYIKLGHMEKITRERLFNENESYYLPHHAVCRDNSLTTKLRVVFDASCPSSSGQSLNDVLLKGPCVQQDLICIVSRFRTHRYVFSADIEKMYRQIWVDSEDCEFQKILWRSNPEDNIEEYRLKTVTYGTKPASFLATACLKKLAENESEINSIVYQTIICDFYMDDLLSGSDSINNAVMLCNDVTNIMSKAGFALRKWVTNEDEILRKLGFSDNNSMQILDLNGKSTKTLGLYWNPIYDTYNYEVNDISNKNNNLTKRTVLSLIATLFDPLGLIGPVIVRAKLIMQTLWKLMIDWDESLPITIHDEWLTYQSQLGYLQNIKIPRRIIACDNAYKIQIHGFSDASTTAYGACLYLRATDIDGKHYVRLIVSKSRVAPLKPMSIPRLELCGALLLARLAHKVIPELKLNIDHKYFWTDSTIVLAWLKSESSRWKIFVAHRVVEIQELTPPCEWRHVSSNDNPADVISRGCDASQLNENKLWWHGPSWLSFDEKLWPSNNETQIILKDLPEAKSETNINTAIILDNEFSLITKYSSLQKLYRITAYIKRWKLSIIDKKQFLNTKINVDEILKAEITIIKMIQRQYFYDEIKLLRKSKMVKKTSHLYFLNPFIDDYGVVRVGGRLRYAFSLSSDQRQPIVIPASSSYTKLLFRYEHERLLHAGPQALLASLRDRFWPLNGRNIARITVHKCIQCFKVKPTVVNPIMGDLPRQRVEQSRTFENCGIDFAGPIVIKSSLKRKAPVLKSYICVFICLSTKAVHVEAVGDLTTNSFLAALRRFWSRRGICKNIYSDNATNFVGASRQLKELIHLFSTPEHQNQLQQCLAEVRVKWNFIPAHSPHFGGLWESSIKSIKSHFRKYLGNALLTYEELATVLTQIEACINSRPLFPLSPDPNDLSVLTPAHFLVGGPLTSIPEADVTEIAPNRLQRWQRVSQLTQQLWKRWRGEYLSQLQSRTKWQRRVANLSLGSMVLIKDDNQPSLNWKLGRVTTTHPGSDGVVRAVTIRTGQGETRRAVRNLCPLPEID